MTNLSDLWMAYANQLTEALGSGGFDPQNQQLSIATNSLPLALVGDNPAISAYTVFQLGNTVPVQGPGYAPHDNLSDAYLTFLNSIAFQGQVNPSDQKNLSRAAAKLTTAQANYQASLKGALAAFKLTSLMNPSLSFANFTNSQYPAFGAAYNALLAAQVTYDQLMAQVYGSDYQEVSLARQKAGAQGATCVSHQTSFNMKAAVAEPDSLSTSAGDELPGNAATSGGTQTSSTLYVPAYSLDGFDAAYQSWINDSDSHTGVTIAFSGNSQTSSLQDLGWTSHSHSSSTHDWFIHVSETTNKKGSTQIVHDTYGSFGYEATFKGFGAFNISPTGWFDLSLIDEYKDKLVENAPNLFGADGSLARLPYQVIIGFQPKIELSFSQSDYHRFHKTFSETKTERMSIGPFDLGHKTIHEHSEKTAVTFNSAEGKVIIDPPAGVQPCLLGVISSKL